MIIFYFCLSRHVCFSPLVTAVHMVLEFCTPGGNFPRTPMIISIRKNDFFICINYIILTPNIKFKKLKNTVTRTVKKIVVPPHLVIYPCHAALVFNYFTRNYKRLGNSLNFKVAIN